MRPILKITDYTYPLPDDRIAKYPLSERDASKLLVNRNGVLTEDCFRNISRYLDGSELMIFNNTRVVPARLFFRKDSGAHIEVFCLEPHNPADYNLSFAETGACEWNCIVGNVKKWKTDQQLTLINPDNSAAVAEISLKATIVSRDGANVVVRFSWDGGKPFSEVLDICGQIPIPPYLNRDTEESDYLRYQTLYARHRGSVAAPTAGLHFTERVMADIEAMGIRRDTVCLHVGAGTFMPVKSEFIEGHRMHREHFSISASVINDLVNAEKDIVAVGTTSIRTLESLYYIGVHIIENGEPGVVGQWEPYDRDYTYSTDIALKAIVSYLQEHGADTLVSATEIIIVPGFEFRIVDRLVTNFHQPQSTLLLLISAFLGGDWQKMYEYALDHGFRFLSYGDSSLLYRRKM